MAKAMQGLRALPTCPIQCALKCIAATACWQDHRKQLGSQEPAGRDGVLKPYRAGGYLKVWPLPGRCPGCSLARAARTP